MDEISSQVSAVLDELVTTRPAPLRHGGGAPRADRAVRSGRRGAFARIARRARAWSSANVDRPCGHLSREQPASSAGAWPSGWSRAGHDVRCLVRDRGRAAGPRAARLRGPRGQRARSRGACRARARGVDVAYYLVHSMGRGGERRLPLATRPRGRRARSRRWRGARAIDRVVYLGGLGDDPRSEHLRSRHETAETLRAEGPPLTYLRAAMVVGAGSESYRTLRYLVERLPAMIAPAWLSHPDAADRGRRRPLLPGAGAGRARVGRPRDPDRRARRALLRRHARSRWPTCSARRRRPKVPGAVPHAARSRRCGSASSPRSTRASRGR